MKRWLTVLAALALVLAVLLFWQRQPLWRSVSPYLPARLQALPYRLQPGRTPVALPTVVQLVSAGEVTLTPTITLPTALPRPSATQPPLPGTALVPGIRHAYQRWNNCGPVTVAMALSALGDTVDQTTAASTLKPDPDDKNVGPEELAAFARSRGFESTMRVNGDLNRLRAFVAAGLPVIVETWFIPKPGDEMGHYRLVTGYDDAQQVVHTADSYEGPDVVVSYAELDRFWRVFNRSYVVAWPADRAGEVAAILGDTADDEIMFVRAAADAQADVMAAPDAFAWFNLGSSLAGLGDMGGAARAFDQARALGLPWRMLWYQFGPFEAYAAMERWSDVATLADANLRNAGNLEESLYWRGRAKAATGDAAGAKRDFDQAVSLNPHFNAAQSALGDPP